MALDFGCRIAGFKQCPGFAFFSELVKHSRCSFIKWKWNIGLHYTRVAVKVSCRTGHAYGISVKKKFHILSHLILKSTTKVAEHCSCRCVVVTKI